MNYFLVVLFVLIILFILIYISNNVLKIKKYYIVKDKLPSNFNGLKIVHISDVHSRLYGENNCIIKDRINNIKPDIIIMSGDIIDKNEKDIDGFLENYKEIFKTYPTYYSIGNHERKLGYSKYKSYIEKLRLMNVHVIINGSEKYVKGDQYIVINALKFRENMQSNLTDEKKEKLFNYMKNKLYKLDKEEFNILITHDPENFKMYKRLGVDLVFSGHVHGGLIRFGKICLLSPRRKLFPKYSYGVNTEGKTTIITSSGMGKASIPIRLFNRPEIVEVIVKTNN